MEKYELQKLRDLPILGVAERLGLQVARRKCLCPFHDDHHASLSFSTRRNTYRCFVCGAHGDTISLVMNHLGKTFPDACRWLADAHNVILADYQPRQHTTDGEQQPFDARRYERFFEHPFLNDEARRFLFDERRLDPRVVAWCRLGSWRDRSGTPWLQIPYYDRDGRLVGVQNRRLTPSSAADAATPRFRFPRGADVSLYNLPVLNRLRPADDLYIAEGATDCLALLSSGRRAIAVPSATMLRPRHADLLGQLAASLGLRFHIYPDADLPGEHLYEQLSRLLPSLQRHNLPPGCKDFADYYRQTLRAPP